MRTRLALACIAAGLTMACAPVCWWLRSVGKPTPPVCPPLPQGFTEADLVGTWVAEYFGGTATDRLILREDGLYRQVFSTHRRRVETEWQHWWIEYKPEGHAWLHLEGMHRCDDLESVCEHPGGGLPPGLQAVDQCTKKQRLEYAGEVILFVTGAPGRPRGIELQHARMAGTPYYYTFTLEE